MSAKISERGNEVGTGSSRQEVGVGNMRPDDKTKKLLELQKTVSSTDPVRDLSKDKKVVELDPESK
jgi:hypothetical protein